MTQQGFEADQLQRYNNARPINAQRKLCHAPHQNMFFGRDGQVTACCYNRTQILGRYPDQSPLDMWTGDLARRLQAGMTDTSMPDGCSSCAQQLEAGNISGLHARLYDKYADAPLESIVKKFKQLQTGNRNHRDLGQNIKLEWETLIRKLKEWIYGTGRGIPIGRIARQEFKRYVRSCWGSNSKNSETAIHYPRCLEFELSNTCNLECAMCFGEFSSAIRKNREGLPPLEERYDAAFIPAISKFLENAWETKFYGGEPFLIPVYYDLWEVLISRNPHAPVNITTNGTVFNNKVRRILEKLNVVLIVSIDSFEKSTYEQIRINANFERVMENFEAFIKIMRSKGRPLSLAVCPMTLNWREIPDILRRCNDGEFPLYFNTLWFPLELSLRHLSSAELQEIVDFYMQQELTDGALVQRENNAMFLNLIHQLELWRDLALDLEYKHTQRTSLQDKLKQNELYRTLGRIQEQRKAGVFPVDQSGLDVLIKNAENAETFIRQYFGVLRQSIVLHKIAVDTTSEQQLSRRIERVVEYLLAHHEPGELLQKIAGNDHSYTTTLLAQLTFEQNEDINRIWKTDTKG